MWTDKPPWGTSPTFSPWPLHLTYSSSSYLTPPPPLNWNPPNIFYQCIFSLSFLYAFFQYVFFQPTVIDIFLETYLTQARNPMGVVFVLCPTLDTKKGKKIIQIGFQVITLVARLLRKSLNSTQLDLLYFHSIFLVSNNPALFLQLQSFIYSFTSNL